MATLTSAEIANLQTARASLISALSSWSGESPVTASYSIAGRKHDLRGPDEIMQAIESINKMLDWSTAGNPASRVSYGRPRRYR